MSEWKESKMQDVTLFIKDGTHGTHKDFQEGIPLLSAKDIENGKIYIPDNCRMVSESDYKQLHTNYEIENDDILLTVVGTIGRVAIAKKLSRKITFQRSVSIIRFNKTKIHPEYSFHYFQAAKFQKALERSKNASAQGGVYLGELAKIKLYHPIEFEVQQRIAKILTTCDTVIEQTQSAIAKYKAIKQGMLHDLFTRGLDASGKLRPTYQQAPELYKESELGMIPKEWEVKRLEEIANLNPKSKELPEEFIYIDLESVEAGKLMQENLIKRKDAPSRAQRLLISNDIIYQMVRPYQKNNLYFINENKNIRYVASTGYAQLRAVESSDYLYYQLHNDKFVNDVLCKCTGSNYPAINSSELSSIKVVKPSFNEQKVIAGNLKAIDKKLRSEETLLSKYQSIKRGLMGDLLSGKKEV